MDEYLNEKEAALFLKRSVSTLQSWRCNKLGPVFIKDKQGGIRYKKSDLINFIEADIVETD